MPNGNWAGESACPTCEQEPGGAGAFACPRPWTNSLAADLDHILENTAEVWEELRGSRIFITGGTGFFGCWLLESFAWANDKLDLGAEAVVLTRNPEAFRGKARHLAGHPAIELHKGDICEFDFPAGRFSHVIHAATESSTGLNEREPLRMLDSIVTGTRRTLDFAVAAGARKFLLTSSGMVYGKQPPELTHVPETYAGAPDPADPRSAYGEGKRVAELLCAIYHQAHGIETKIARCFAFVGPYLPLDAHFAAGNFIRDAMARQPIEIKGDGTPLRTYMYAADLAIWLWTVLARGASCRPYNVGAEEEVSIADLAGKVVETLEPRLAIRVAGRPQPGVPAARYVPATGRARNELQLAVQVPLADAIERTAACAPAEALS
jgi:dTDP-glucose 4,6-dehydratase